MTKTRIPALDQCEALTASLLISISLLCSAVSGCSPRHTDELRHQAQRHSDTNAYMNRHSFKDLVQRFEDPQREAWQEPAVVIRAMGELSGRTIIDIVSIGSMPSSAQER